MRQSVSADAIENVVAAFSRGGSISPIEQEAIRLAGRRAESFGAGAHVFSGGGGRRTGLIVDGWACEICILLDGRRQILSILLPGDPIFPRHSRCRGGRSIVALTNLHAADISALVQTDSPTSQLSHVMKDALDQREERLLTQITRLGRLSAYERVVHLLLELRDRLNRVGQVADEGFCMPLTQEAMSDVLGLSVVHLNRTLQQLRRERLVEIRSGRVTLLRPRALASIIGDDDWEEGTVDGRGFDATFAAA